MIVVRFVRDTTLPLFVGAPSVMHAAWLQLPGQPNQASGQPGAVGTGQFAAGEIAGFADEQGQALIDGGHAVPA